MGVKIIKTCFHNEKVGISLTTLSIGPFISFEISINFGYLISFQLLCEFVPRLDWEMPMTLAFFSV